jgi:hypothetical protein
MKVLVCGSRNWFDRNVIFRRLSQLSKDTVVLEGEASGADSLARDVAIALSLEVRRFPADWEKYGRAAGPIRNREMLDEKPDLVIAFHSDLWKSRGTADTVREAKKRGIPVEVIT